MGRFWKGWQRQRALRQSRGNLSMHSLMIVALFVGMVLAPCVVAMFTGIE
jgi:hypothetical protein